MRKKISFISLLLSGLFTANAQIKTIYKSDSLVITCNNDSSSNTAKITQLKFGSSFSDTVQLILDNKCIFSGHVNTDRSTGIAIDISYIDIPAKKRSKLKIKLINEKITLTTKVIPGYNFLYIYKHFKQLTLYYKNEELFAE